MTDLFDRDPLEDGTGLLSERWGQQGSNIVNIDEGVSDLTEETIYTVSAGKTLFVTDIVVQIVSSGGTSNDYGFLEDGDGGTEKISIRASSYSGGEVINFNFKTPLKFETSIYWAHGSPSISMSAAITISGWEEDGN